jgi:hypothetical protein
MSREGGENGKRTKANRTIAEALPKWVLYPLLLISFRIGGKIFVTPGRRNAAPCST